MAVVTGIALSQSWRSVKMASAGGAPRAASSIPTQAYVLKKPAFLGEVLTTAILIRATVGF